MSSAAINFNDLNAAPAPAQPQAAPQSGALNFNDLAADMSQPQQPGFFSRVVSDVLHAPMSGYTESSAIQGAPVSSPDQASSVVRGAEKGATQTASTISKLAGGSGASAAETTPQGFGENVGNVAEGIAEAVGADGALKGLSLGDRLLQIHRVADAYEKAGPIAKAAIQAGLTSARNAVTGAVVGGAHGGESGAEAGAAAGAVAEPAGAVAGKLASGAANAIGKVWDSVSGRAIQSGLQAGVRSIVQDVADDAGVPAPDGSVRTVVEKLADNVQAKSKDLFATIDSATDGEWTNIQNRIRNVQQRLRETIGTDPDLEAKLDEQLTGLRSRADDALEAAQKAGVDPKVADEARAAWRQMSALRDVDGAVKASTTGNDRNAPAVVDPLKLSNRLQKLDDAKRLVEGVGEEAANSLLQHVYDARNAVVARANRISTAISASKIAGAGAGLIEGARLAFGGKQ